MKKYTFKTARLTAGLYMIAILGIVVVVYSCNKSKCAPQSLQTSEQVIKQQQAAQPLQQNLPQVKEVTIANIRKSGDGTLDEVLFNQLAEVFTVKDADVLASLHEAFSSNKAINAKFDPWTGVVEQVFAISDKQAALRQSHIVTADAGTSYSLNLATASSEEINNTASLAVLNQTTTGLNNVIPDMATAQAIFNYITKQCCAISGPYAIDHCISFQYCQDGCYARAHKMCWILNNTYHYDTHKIFSFANSGSDHLSVKCQKWGGCCVTWWYHVAPLVNIKTTTGVKAFVFDPAMFDQPVLLATWLHAQENPACSATPHVSMISIQPTTAYSPANYAGTSFDTDPMYTNTNSTLVSYSPLHTCP